MFPVDLCMPELDALFEYVLHFGGSILRFVAYARHQIFDDEEGADQLLYFDSECEFRTHLPSSDSGSSSESESASAAPAPASSQPSPRGPNIQSDRPDAMDTSVADAAAATQPASSPPPADAPCDILSLLICVHADVLAIDRPVNMHVLTVLQERVMLDALQHFAPSQMLFHTIAHELASVADLSVCGSSICSFVSVIVLGLRKE
jgi:hypothetical protein